MFKYLNKKRGQSTLEYAILIIIVIGALLSIQVYIKRGLQGRLKSATDDIGDQYSVGNTNIVIETRIHSKTADTFGVSGIGESKSTLLEAETTNVLTNVILHNVQQEFWGK
jgi:hypothetical protein